LEEDVKKPLLFSSLWHTTENKKNEGCSRGVVVVERDGAFNKQPEVGLRKERNANEKKIVYFL
jgi:hypothetical protein